MQTLTVFLGYCCTAAVHGEEAFEKPSGRRDLNPRPLDPQILARARDAQRMPRSATIWQSAEVPGDPPECVPVAVPGCCTRRGILWVQPLRCRASQLQPRSAFPFQWARSARVVRCQGGRGRGSARGWAAGRRTARGLRPHPRPPPPKGEVVPGVQGAGVVGAEDPLADGQQGGILVVGRVAWVVAVCRAWPAADRCSPTLAATQANRRGAFANAAYVLLAGKGLPPRMTRSEPGNRWRPALCDRY